MANDASESGEAIERRFIDVLRRVKGTVRIPVGVKLTVSHTSLERVKTLREGLARWLERNEYDSLSQLRGSMNIARIPDPEAMSRAHYMHLLSSWGTR